MKRCPALFITAPASGQGKTTVVSALARHYRDLRLNVRVFKTGPDFLDPMILEKASGAPVYQLDPWMGGENHCRQLLYDAAGEADLILVEGVMGLFDGETSSADLAKMFAIPVLAVIDGSAMAQTFGAIAHGLASYRPGLTFLGVFANRVANEHHYRMLEESLSPGIASFGWLPRDGDLALPERHLGLVQADEIDNLDIRITRTASALKGLPGKLPMAVYFIPASGTSIRDKPLDGLRIAIARDAAFAFLYRANLDVLVALGARLKFFSPLTDKTIPESDALYLPGGYPELHLDTLASNSSIKAGVRLHHAAGKPIIAECGGMLYLLESLTDTQGHSASMAGLLPGHARMQNRLANLGLHQVSLPEGTLRAHTFHYSQVSTPLIPIATSKGARPGRKGEPIYREGHLHASYVHLYFPSNPVAIAKLFAPNHGHAS
uniref:Hydrogenobyrinic acid a,c-diamide synthase (Glutamine-hydrolysing) /cobyrinate a,c-diamide synthase n=1 Tax=Candidatus Kentrum sp. MB TaxID=2138164 RepID=A0A450XFK2_9GAMM|nr:MAG: hydrogenobyrinic acid a,c-diamide synthase (glutamine-hydrolysing) /cobyrinate a,c-diamide synthase [Candidatus Kentron sp. MB]